MTPFAASAGDNPTPRDPRRALIDQLTAERYAPVPPKPPADSPRARQVRRRELNQEKR